ncbi:MAG: endonuclease/exonuclease/phosphatase family protein [Planctomycetota bacterium]|nr:endonuclease/exonuclease/phosphatase family protein [Planctomycetota bacterium]
MAVRLMSVAACLVASLAGVPAAFAGSAPDYVPLRVVTYNVKSPLGAPGSSDALAAGAFMTTQDVDGTGPNTGLSPDIVCFQEIEQSAASNLVNFRNTYLPGYAIYTAAGDGFNFNATLVRPGITFISHSGLNVGGPRQVGKTRLRVPGTLKDVIVYNAHFKSGSDSSSRTQRTNNATTSGFNVEFELQQNPGANVIFAGDLNSDNNVDGTITPLFFTSVNPSIPSGILNLPVESLAGAANPNVLAYATFPSSGGRLDYICLDTQLAAFFDANSDGGFSVSELNSMGFVYYSPDDAGRRSNGNATATNSTSDHRPVVFDVRLPRDPNAPYFEPSDLNQNGSVDIEDLAQWENGFALTAPPTPSPAPDLDGDRNVDGEDRLQLRSRVRSGELADVAGM